MRIETPGLWIVGYRSRPSPVVLPAELFERYLAQEGLERIIEIRAQRGESAKWGQEIYSRCAKSILSAGVTPYGRDRRLGFTLELIADGIPYALQPGQDLFVTLLHEGKPLPAALPRSLSPPTRFASVHRVRRPLEVRGRLASSKAPQS